MAKTKKETPSVQLVKKKTVASKSTINLSCHKSSFQPKRVIPVVLIIIVVGALFAKFGFLDLIDKKGDAYSDLAQKQETYSAVNARLIGYDELADQYGRYSYGWLTETEASLVDRMDLRHQQQRGLREPLQYHPGRNLCAGYGAGVRPQNRIRHRLQRQGR